LVCDVELVCKVPPEAFVPPPKVESGALLLRRKAKSVERLEPLLHFVSACFRQKRKTLRNNLRGIYRDAIEQQPEASLRAEQLSIAQFQDLFARLYTGDS
jgi:16S rRNA (adenine1518-N6/adenine1519-N6)-dimethyltransferase